MNAREKEKTNYEINDKNIGEDLKKRERSEYC